MKKNWQAAIIIAALNIVLGATSGMRAQQIPMAGAYAETSTSNPEVVAAARFAIREKGRRQGARISLLSIEGAEMQVVAGLNYRLRMRVKVNNKTQDVTAVVYRNLREKYSLSSWAAASNHAGTVSAFSNSTVEQLVKALDTAYLAKALGDLDAESPLFRKVKIVIEHSLADDRAQDRFEIKEFKTFAEGEQWLRSREREDAPARVTKPLLRCKKGLCTYDFAGGILHNQLYLRKISYGLRSGKPYIKTIFLLDGD